MQSLSNLSLDAEEKDFYPKKNLSKVLSEVAVPKYSQSKPLTSDSDFSHIAKKIDWEPEIASQKRSHVRFSSMQIRKAATKHSRAVKSVGTALFAELNNSSSPRAQTFLDMYCWRQNQMDEIDEMEDDDNETVKNGSDTEDLSESVDEDLVVENEDILSLSLDEDHLSEENLVFNDLASQKKSFGCFLSSLCLKLKDEKKNNDPQVITPQLDNLEPPKLKSIKRRPACFADAQLLFQASLQMLKFEGSLSSADESSDDEEEMDSENRPTVCIPLPTKDQHHLNPKSSIILISPDAKPVPMQWRDTNKERQWPMGKQLSLRSASSFSIEED